MDVDDQIQCKFPRIANGTAKLGHTHKMDDQYPDEEEEGDTKRGGGGNAAAVRAAAIDLGGGVGRFYGWPSSRIVRVSRASGGKDRHSKVLTSKGLRDRRVRLSVNTAIQFYDLQDRLGYDQPSKAVEWLLKAAATSIAELPPMNTLFPDTPKQLSDEKRTSTAFESAEVDLENYSQQQVTKSSAACSSTSETSKGSGLSLSRSESRIKARERAKERVAEKEKESSMNPISHTTSFTELLNGGMNNHPSSPNANAAAQRHWSSPSNSNSTPMAMDYFSPGLLAPPRSANPFMSEHHPELQHFSFMPENFAPVGNNNNSSIEYNLNFTISSSTNSSGFNRGTLQSNSSSQPSLLPHLQRYSEGSAPSFFIGTADTHHHQFLSGYDSRGLQLCYGDTHANNGRHSTQRGKGKN